VKLRLWGKSAGRCEYTGCNSPLWLDPVTKAEFNTAYIAHIIADKPTGPRGHPTLSPALRAEISNLMLLCDVHHRLIDKEDVAGHPVALLLGMKKRHEERVELLGSLTPEKRTHIVLYDARIGTQHAGVSFHEAVEAILPDRFPAESRAIELGLKNSFLEDKDPTFWAAEREHLQAHFESSVRPRLTFGDVKHFSVFGFAPQPLLMVLGGLLSDVYASDVYQRHREPNTWRWQEDGEGQLYRIIPPTRSGGTPALNLSLSATITNDRIEAVLGPDCSIWTLSIDNPDNDFLRKRAHLTEFRQTFRHLLDHVKAIHDPGSVLHVFPALPVAVAVEIGRVRMPKADLPLKVYDQNTKNGGFSEALVLA
jgi:hypothetical protein